MSVSLIKSPDQYVLDTTSNSATVSDDGFGFAKFTKTAHGLNTGDVIYIYSTLENYNGYWFITKIDANSFKIANYSTIINEAYIITVSVLTVTYYKSVLRHGWNCVHLPIVYKFQTTAWPSNQIDILRTVTTFTNYKGYTYLKVSGDIKTTGNASAFEYVLLTGTTGPGGVSLDGVYKILNWFSDTNFVINLPYSAGNVFSSTSVQYYYNNYHIRIRIYAGFDSNVYWNSVKGGTLNLITEIKVYPSTGNIVDVNISEYLKKYISIFENNTLKVSMPSDVDSFCSFGISYAESYDDSNMYTVSEFVSSYTASYLNSGDPDFVGFYAINAKLPFKTRSRGGMSQYVSGSTSTTKQKWLTNFTRPSLFVGKYFDIAFIKNLNDNGSYILREVYRGGVLKEQFKDSISALTGPTVYRYAVTQSGWAEDRIDLTYYNASNVALSETITIDVVTTCAFTDFYLVWLNNLAGHDYWNFTAKRGKKYSIDILDSQTQDKDISTNWDKYNNFNDLANFTGVNSYGEFADSITKQTIRRSKNRIAISSQLLTQAQEDAIKLIVSSGLVQLCTSQYDRQTMIVVPDTLDIKQDRDKTLSLSFQVMYTDEIPTQGL